MDLTEVIRFTFQSSVNRVHLTFCYLCLQWHDTGMLNPRGKMNLCSSEVSLVCIMLGGWIGQNPHLGSSYMWQETDVQLFFYLIF